MLFSICEMFRNGKTDRSCKVPGAARRAENTAACVQTAITVRAGHAAV